MSTHADQAILHITNRSKRACINESSIGTWLGTMVGLLGTTLRIPIPRKHSRKFPFSGAPKVNSSATVAMELAMMKYTSQAMLMS